MNEEQSRKGAEKQDRNKGKTKKKPEKDKTFVKFVRGRIVDGDCILW